MAWDKKERKKLGMLKHSYLWFTGFWTSLDAFPKQFLGRERGRKRERDGKKGENETEKGTNRKRDN